ncbi:MAG: glycosyltransferase family 4 protein [Lachnospiraceae bacterium]|nr:glycosyltransferase family 4 protein [Lachnospiraceae bacterium]
MKGKDTCKGKYNVTMIGVIRSFKGGPSAMVGRLYEGGLAEKVNLTYIGTALDGSKLRKLIRAICAYLHFLLILPRMDILHANTSSDASFWRKRIFLETAAFFKKKVIISMRCGRFQMFYQDSNLKTQAKIKATLNKADAFIVVAKPWVDFFATLLPLNKIVILRNAIALPPEGKQDFANQNILVLSRLNEDKGIGELLGIMPRIFEKFPLARLFLGGNWASKELEEKAKELGGRVKFLGWLDEAGKEKYRAMCSLFVLPTHFDGQPNAVLEAMAAGMAIVTTNVGGLPEVITDGINGSMIAPKNEEALFHALSSLLENEALRKSYGKAARKQAESRYKLADNIEALYKIYEGVMN